MDEPVKPKVKRAPQVRLENLDAQTVRKLSRSTGIEIPYLLRQAVQLLTEEWERRAEANKSLGKLKDAIQQS